MASSAWRHFLFYASLIQKLDGNNQLTSLSPGTLSFLFSMVPRDGLPLLPRLRHLTWNEQFYPTTSNLDALDLFSLLHQPLYSFHLRIKFVAEYISAYSVSFQEVAAWIANVIDVASKTMPSFQHLKKLMLDSVDYTIVMDPAVFLKIKNIEDLKLRHVDGMCSSITTTRGPH